MCSDGWSCTSDFAVLGAGSIPNDDLARTAGLAMEHGISVNEYNQTSDPDIYAIGDCCRQFHPVYGRHIRIESVQNAVEQAKTVAASLIGRPVPSHSIPWFWSDQYAVKLQIAGLSDGYNRVVVRGSTQPGCSCSAWYFLDARLLAVDAVNDAVAYAVAMKCLKAGLSPDPDHVGDARLTTKSLFENAGSITHA
jgi:3-phenylpropionate/trans-cinnamate dioxygenase ferredoxin reductase subunit